MPAGTGLELWPVPIVVNKTTDKITHVVFTVRPRAVQEDDGLYRGFDEVSQIFYRSDEGSELWLGVRLL